ncbi:cyanophycinase [Flavobacterium selenitireducens]|uniref:cyanophycinase n=1 Tax=Flavobacterium selenitireducens TaxID=2722704 RepID=UPI00168AF869|nr:cyanophycinase [Flavobacterium selenitireducens]MBD3583074.1 cyanophycinase [Flavobacterium selenitireducens]
MENEFIRPKAKLIIIGGAEDRGEHENTSFRDDGILRRVVSESKKGIRSRIEIITAASALPDELGRVYQNAFQILGASDIGTLSITSREAAFDVELIERLQNTDVAFFTGGDQLRLTTVLGDTPFLKTLVSRLQEDDFLYAGTSAGAAAVASVMIVGGRGQSSVLKGNVKTAKGFGLIDSMTFDTHFMRRGRIGRLVQVIAANSSVLGIGLSENTGILLWGDDCLEVVGEGSVMIVDGRSIGNTNVSEVQEGFPVSVRNLSLHVLAKGDKYDPNETKRAVE